MKKTVAILILCAELLCLSGIVSAGNIEAVRAQVYAWGDAWQNRDIDTYMSFYSPKFQSQGLDFASWRKKKAEVFKHISSIQIEISDLWVFIENKQAVARFIQQYSHPMFTDIGEKTLVMVDSGLKWQIVSEEWKPIVISGRSQSRAKKTEKVVENKATSHAKAENITKLNAKPYYPNQKELRVENQEAAADATKANHAAEPDARAQTAPESVIAFNTNNHQLPQDQKDKEDKRPSSGKTVVKSIKFEIENKMEKIFIDLNKYAVPRVRTLEGDKPRIVLDFMNAASWQGPFRIPANGKLVKQIRAYLHRDVGKLRIVLDLYPAENYIVDQTFYKAESIYCITVQ